MHLPGIGQFMEFCYLSAPRIAPDGKTTAYVVTQIAEDSYHPVLWVHRRETGPLRLAALGQSVLYAWEGDRHILFARAHAKQTGPEQTAFYRISLEGGEAVRAFSIPRAAEEILPLGDGSYLVLVLEALPQPEGTPAGGDCQVLDELPYWFNGRGIVNGKRRRLYCYDEARNQLTPITGAEEEVSLFCVNSGKDRVACVIKKHGGILEDKGAVWEYEIATGQGRQRLDSRFVVDYMEYWNETLVLAASPGLQYGQSENPGIYLLGRENTPLLLAEPDASIGDLVNTDCRYGKGGAFQVWGDTLYYLSLQGHTTCLWQMPLTGGDAVPLTPEATCVDAFCAGEDGVALVAFAPGGLQELYALEGGALQPLTDLNDGALAQLWRGTPQHHTFVRDGFSIDGWALLPADYDLSQSYPAILNIHGGPKGAYGDIYFHEMQYWAARGYFVLFCNPRGSDGKGNAFADIRGQYGGGDYADIMMFVDEMLRAYPAIDPERLGVTGGSYGGFMTNWIIGHTNRFAAAASQRGIANWLSFAGNSDIGYSFAPDQLAADLWDTPRELWRQSPLKYADSAVTPTLFIHSDEDYRCWVSEAYQMFTALKRRGVETRLCLFQGENHELSRSGKPQNRVRRLQEITAWMDRYLKPKK